MDNLKMYKAIVNKNGICIRSYRDFIEKSDKLSIEERNT